VRKRYKVTTDSAHDQPIADNLLRQQFDADRPNQRWVGDTSECVIGENGKLYLAVILDLFSRFVVGWAVSNSTVAPKQSRGSTAPIRGHG
jgi:putative transposase